MDFNDIAGPDEGHSRTPVPGQPDGTARDLEVDRIETCGVNVDQHVLGTRNGIRDISQPNMVGDGTIAVEKEGAHGSPFRA